MSAYDKAQNNLSPAVVALLAAAGISEDRILPASYDGWGLIASIAVPAAPLVAIAGLIYATPPILASVLSQPDEGAVCIYDAVSIVASDNAAAGASPTPADTQVLEDNCAIRIFGERCSDVGISLFKGMSAVQPWGVNQTLNLARQTWSAQRDGVHHLEQPAVWSNGGGGADQRAVRLDVLNVAAPFPTPPGGATVGVALNLLVFIRGIWIPASIVENTGLARPKSLHPRPHPLPRSTTSVMV